MDAIDIQPILDYLQPVIGVLPQKWRDALVALVMVLLALRAFLRGVVAFLSYLDVAIDGESNWTWVSKSSDALDAFDRYLARGPIKVPFLLEKRDHAQPLRKSVL